MHILADKFFELFEGLSRARGECLLTGGADDQGKIRTKSSVIREPPTIELWSKHLEGEAGLGIIPINDENMVKWGAIDVDKYDQDLGTVARKVKDNKLPLVPCRSKSGGLHLFLFVKEWVPAEAMQSKLRSLAAYLGFGNSELFPKQIQLISERGDVGSWLNMPYFDAAKTMRFAFNGDGESVNVEQFLVLASARRLSREEFDNYATPLKSKTDGTFRDAPPCLEHLAVYGLPDGVRNNGLFSFGVYFRRKYPDDWKQRLADFNTRTPNPLHQSELAALAKSLGGKEYRYRCKDEPCCSLCNASLCRSRKYGVADGALVVESITCLETTPPIWFVSIEGGGRLELTSEELYNQAKFHVKCMEKCRIVPPTLKTEVWRMLLNEKLKDAAVVAVPEEAKLEGTLRDFMEKFLLGRVQATCKDDLLAGKPWFSNGRHYFKLSALMDFLKRHDFRDMKQNHIVKELKNNYEVEHHREDIGGHMVAYWSVPNMGHQETAPTNGEVPY